MNKTLKSILALIAMAIAGSLGAASFATLDEKIVDAYNAEPKRMQDVYIYAMQMIERSRMEHSGDAEEWQEKGEKLVTVSCFVQVDRFLGNNDLQEAYLWALRGVANGASRGNIDGVEIQQIHEYLKHTAEMLKKQLGNAAPSYGETKLQILDWRKVKKSSELHRDYRTDVAGRAEVKDVPYEVISGPAKDDSGLLTVSVKLNVGSMVKIRFFRDKGWTIIAPPVLSGGYYPTWQQCAAECVRMDNLHDAPPIRNKVVERAVYDYQPSGTGTPNGGKK